ncbi:hypothetical protein MES5069_70285 [Mesorhizobium escarrei]|uniref:Uncharacterized protein n=1 Tax=Mesorhizobium escarrei TaxID=666018 RepID=A0ABM9EH13_9HYPH|nr:hypothetical protein MES5069_70285 [Mesorhizobium escarrei]
MIIELQSLDKIRFGKSGLAKFHRFVPLVAPHTKPRQAFWQVRAWVEIEPEPIPIDTSHSGKATSTTSAGCRSPSCISTRARRMSAPR